MTFIPVNFDDAVEPKPAPAGRYNLQILECKVTESGANSKNPGRPQFKVVIGFQDEPNTPNIQHYISLPHPDDEPSSANFKALLLKRFLTLFKIPFDRSGVDTDKLAMEMVGATANAEVRLGEPNDNGDTFNQLVTPKIREEETKPTSGRRR